LATDQYLTVIQIEKEKKEINNIKSKNSTTFIQFRNIPSQNEIENPIYILIPKKCEDPCRDEDILFMLDPCVKIQTV
jgi:hypothetical protein